MNDPAASPTPVASGIGSRKGSIWFLASVAFATFLAKLDRNIVNISLPTIGRDFRADSGEVSWILLSFLAASCSTLILFGKLGDRLGMKRVFVAGYGLFLVSSLVCGLAWSLPSLVVARFAQGLATAMMMASALALVSRHLPGDVAGRAFGTLTTAGALGTFVGAPLGGFLTGYLSWHWVFLVNVPFCLFAIAAASRHVPADPPPAAREGLDAAGAALSLVGISSFLCAVNLVGDLGWRSPTVVALLFASLAAASLFVLRERRAKDPMVDPRIFRERSLSWAMLATFLAFVPIAGSNFLLPFYLHELMGMPPERIGLVVLLYSVALLLGSPVGGWLSDRLEPRLLCAGAMLLGTVAFCGFGLLLHHPSMAVVAPFMLLSGLAYALFASPNSKLIMRMAPPSMQGVVSGIANTVVTLAAGIGVSLFEGLYSSGLGKNAPPAAHAEGFRTAVLLGAVLCFGAFLTSSLSGGKER